MTINSTVEFYLDDFKRTLFPLNSNKILIENGHDLIKEYIKKCFDETEGTYNFMPQERVHAAKQGFHLRRTVKLDPVAEFYIYDFSYNNRSIFRRPHKSTRSSFGYRFENGEPTSATNAYKAFRTAISKYRQEYAHFISFDIATYFNSIYQHDLVNWFNRLRNDNNDYIQFGQYLRQIQSGRSMDCLTQGLYPTKMIGNDFIRFVDDSIFIKSEQLLRFMDDFYLFSNDIDTLRGDFVFIQKLLGEKGFSVNSAKTNNLNSTHVDVIAEINNVKKKLLDRRRELVDIGDYDSGSDFVEMEFYEELSEEELDYIEKLLATDDLAEEDVELILTTMKHHADEVGSRLDYIIASFPHLAKNVALFCENFRDKEFVGKVVLDFVRTAGYIQEYQLFWFGYMIENYLLRTKHASDLISAVFSHSNSTTISKAKILEIADNRFGLPELRETFLKQSDWLAWSAAVGSRSLSPAERNYKLAYFGNMSNMNYLIKQIISRIP